MSYAEGPENPMESIKVPKMPTAIQPINGKPTISPLGADMRGNQFWKERARKYENIIIDLVTEQAKGIKLDSIEITRESVVFKKSQPEPTRINLNEPIKVKLTDWGKEIYYHQYDKINHIAGREICKPKFPKEDENGYTKFQLWDFMELYGEYIGLTRPNVIEPLEIVYEK